jgi:diguanylate cyclase (GGDEF)-like protein
LLILSLLSTDSPARRTALVSRVDDPLFLLRVRATQILLPLVALTAIGTWLQLRRDQIAVTDYYLLPAIALLFTGSAVWLALDSRRVNVILMFTLLLAAAYELIDLYTTFAMEMNRSSAFGQGAVWFSVVTVTAFVVLSERRALNFGIVYNALGVIINFVAFQGGLTALQMNALLQFHAANAAILVLMWLVSQLQTRYTEANRLAHTDPLTGLPNRRALQARLETAAHVGKVFSVVMLDVDFFKQINDARGHAFGDEVLREIAFTLVNHVPNHSSVARWGGEEFLILLPGLNAEHAKHCAAQLCQAVMRAHPGGVEITLSAGVAQWKTGDSMKALLERADEALYRVKATGRNRATLME